MKKIYALIDCNCFFVSCERLFRPELNNQPVVVLSSNDGCVVSRSQEAKDLGIPMGAPHYQWREFFSRRGVVAFSANFELYGDISERITNLLASITPRIEVYSVDESFLDLTELDIPHYRQWGLTVRESILRNVGVPVSVGIAPSKTLTKAANHYAKKHQGTQGVVCLDENPNSKPQISNKSQSQNIQSRENLEFGAWDLVLSGTPVADVWGVGWKLAPKLRAEGIHTALDLRHMSYRRAQQLMGIHGRHLVYELSGTACLPFMKESKPQQMIMRGRQFGEDTREFYVVESAVASLAARAAAALRRERQLARRAAVILSTNRHKPGYQRISEAVRFYTPTSDTGTITSQLMRLLARPSDTTGGLAGTFKPGSEYHKADVLLYDLMPESELQTDLFGTVDLAASGRSQRKMQAVDTLNLRYGKGSVKFAAETLSQAWQPRKKLVSPRYTSAWNELPEVRLV